LGAFLALEKTSQFGPLLHFDIAFTLCRGVGENEKLADHLHHSSDCGRRDYLGRDIS
jgi:hypothetical protein